MDRARLRRILADIDDPGEGGLAARVCGLCPEMLDVGGAGVMVMDGNGAPPAALCSSGALAARIDDLQFTLGEGPAYDAHADGIPVAEPDLSHPLHVRWAALTAPALEAGAAALFAFPLRLGAVRLGALTLHQARVGPLRDAQHAGALAIAGRIVHAVLTHQAAAAPGALARELEPLGLSRAEVHQASGMVSVQLAVSVGEALVRLRAHAYAQDRPLLAVARDVVARRLRLTE